MLVGLAFAESEFISKKKRYDVYLGIKHEGELRFKDTTHEFVDKMNNLIEFCTQEGKSKFIAPFLEKEKEDLRQIKRLIRILESYDEDLIRELNQLNSQFK